MSKASKKSKFSNLQGELISRAKKILNDEICKASDGIFTHMAAVYNNFKNFKEFYDVDSLNEKENLKLTLKKLGKKENPLIISCNFSDSTTKAYISYIPNRVHEQLFEYATYKDIPLLVIQDMCISKVLKANCISYQSNYDFTEMLNDYQPAKIIFFEPERFAYLSESCVLGIYLLDEENNFITKLIIQFIDEKNAPKGCKKLRVPKTVSEFYDSY